MKIAIILEFRDNFGNMKVIVLISFTVLGLISFSQNEQDSILLLNGKVYKGEITGTGVFKDDSVVNYLETKNNGKRVLRNIEMRRIFSYTDSGISRTLYTPNEFLGDYLTVRETRDVTIGSYDARQTFKPHVAFWTSFAVGFGASVWDTYLTKKAASDSTLIAPKEPGFFKGNPSVFPFFVPLVASVSWSLPTFKLKKKKMLHKELHGNENYYRGYHRIAKQRRMLGGLFGSVSGLSLGMLMYFIFR